MELEEGDPDFLDWIDGRTFSGVADCAEAEAEGNLEPRHTPRMV